MTSAEKKARAGYHMLMILSAADGSFSGSEDRIIREFLEEHLTLLKDLDEEMAVLSSLSAIDYPVHFNNAMNNFYMNSSKEERNRFLDQATRLVAVDREISPRENLFLNELYNAWEEEVE